MFVRGARLLAAALLAACPIIAHASPDAPTAPTPERLVVDQESSATLSVHESVQVVEIVLVPSGEYRPVHPDSIDTSADSTGSAADDAQ